MRAWWRPREPKRSARAPSRPRFRSSDLAERWLERGLGLRRGPVHHNIACLLARMGRREDAVKHIVLALRRGSDRDEIRTDPDLAPFRKDPAFVAALKAARRP